MSYKYKETIHVCIEQKREMDNDIEKERSTQFGEGWVNAKI